MLEYGLTLRIWRCKNTSRFCWDDSGKLPMNSVSTSPSVRNSSLTKTSGESAEDTTATWNLGAIFDLILQGFDKMLSGWRNMFPGGIGLDTRKGCADLAEDATMQSATAETSSQINPSRPVEYHFDEIDPMAVRNTPYEECLTEEWQLSRDPRRQEILRRVLLRSKFPAKLIQYEEIESGIRVWPNGREYAGEGELILERPVPLGSSQ